MADNTIYADYVMAGATDAFFKWLSFETGGGFAWDDGNVEAPTGWFAVERVESEDVALFASDNGDPTIGAYVKPNRWYLVQINSDGIVYTVSYEGLDGQRPEKEQRRRALADFNRLRRHYVAWMDAAAKLVMPLTLALNCEGCGEEFTTIEDAAAHDPEGYADLTFTIKEHLA
jgi:hypothetical protein